MSEVRGLIEMAERIVADAWEQTAPRDPARQAWITVPVPKEFRSEEHGSALVTAIQGLPFVDSAEMLQTVRDTRGRPRIATAGFPAVYVVFRPYNDVKRGDRGAA